MMIQSRPQKFLRLNGFNLIEAALVLGIVGLVIGGIWIAASTVDTYLKTNKLIASFESLTLKLAELYKTIDYTGAVSTTGISGLIINAKLWPEDLITNGTMVTPWGDAVTRAQIDNYGNYGFRVILTIPVSATTQTRCIAVGYRLIDLINKPTVMAGNRYNQISMNGIWTSTGSADTLRTFIKTNCPTATELTFTYWLF